MCSRFRLSPVADYARYHRERCRELPAEWECKDPNTSILVMVTLRRCCRAIVYLKIIAKWPET